MFTAVLFAYKNKSVGDKLTPTENLSLILEKWKIYDKNQEICLIFEKSKEISSGYRESGYLPEAVINMLALLGWNSGTEQEIFSLEEFINIFSIDRISKHGAKFDL